MARALGNRRFNALIESKARQQKRATTFKDSPTALDRPERKTAAQEKQKKARTKAFQADRIGELMKAQMAAKNYGLATSFQSGMWPPEVRVALERSFARERTQQVLSHFAIRLFARVRKTVKAEQEIQAMFVNDRIFISANEVASIKQLGSLTANEMREVLFAQGGADTRHARAGAKLRSLVYGSRLEREGFFGPEEEGNAEEIEEHPVQEEELDTIRAILLKASDDATFFLHQMSIEGAAKAINEPKYANCVILVQGLRKAHAEQNLILAYVQSGSESFATVYGKKRPCAGCYMTFVFAQQVMGRKNLLFGKEPGGYWAKALPGLEKLLEIDPEITIDQVDAVVKREIPDLLSRTAAPKAKRSKGKGPGNTKTKKVRSDTKQEDRGYRSESDSLADDMNVADDSDPDEMDVAK